MHIRAECVSKINDFLLLLADSCSGHSRVDNVCQLDLSNHNVSRRSALETRTISRNKL
jgi:hypothetical protein